VPSGESRAFLEQLAQRVLVFDGAMGTSIHALDLPLRHYQGLENCNEILNLTRPDAIESIHDSFLDVGCDGVETNTFGGMRHVLAEFGLEERCYEINVAAAQIAKRAAQRKSTVGRPRWAVGSLGPGTKLISLRQIAYDELLESYFQAARGLLDGGVDVMLIETCQDILQTKTVIEAVRRAFERSGRRVPLMCSVTMETTGTMLVGTDIAAALAAIEAYPEVAVIGLNCATGPQEMSEHIRYLSRTCTRYLSVLPNAGLPQLVGGRTHFPLTPEELARWLKEFVEVDGVNIVGGCCGTTPAHLKAVVEALGGGNEACRLQNAQVRPRTRSPAAEPACSSLFQAVPYRQQSSFLIVGERCNTNGSRAFKRMLAEGDLDGCVHMAIGQVKVEGAHVLDVCVDYVGRDGVPDMQRVIDRFAREVTAPLMLDSTQPEVIEAGLKLAGGKCIINSVNLEDGEHKLARIAGLCRQYGAAVVALTIDEDPQQAMAKTAERKLSIATRLHELLVRRHGLNEEDIFFDCLTFPITTGNAEDRRLGLETLDGIEHVMQRFPRCQSILGLSNISFGLQPAARVVLNSVFLHEARQRGLTAAIVHAGKIVPRNQISDERWNAALDLIYDRREAGDPLERFIGLFAEGEQLAQKENIADLPLEERLKRRIIDGERLGLEKDLDEALTRYSPLNIINHLLLDGMKVVGELFGSGQMQLPFVLKSAECMKTAVAYLEPFMEKQEGASRGRIVLATVRGDVHDIGKNLVDIILTNNGYTVYNLGIKQPINNIIAAWREHRADAIGLSGLLVKSTLVMRDDLGVLNEQGIDVPVILGGAALTRKYVEEDLRALYKGALFYARDAFDGLKLMGDVCEGRAPNSTYAAAAPTGRIAPRNLEKLELETQQRYGLAPIGDTGEADAPAAIEIDALPPSTTLATAGGRSPAEHGAPSAATAIAIARAHPRSGVRHEHTTPRPPFWGSRVIERIPLRAVLAYINESMLFQVQWGFRRKGRTPEQWREYVNAEIRPHYRELVERCEREDILQCQAVYGYWPCNSDGDDLIVYEPPSTTGTEGSGDQGTKGFAVPLLPTGGGRNPTIENWDLPRELARFTFPRQSKPPYRCLSDFWRPLDRGTKARRKEGTEVRATENGSRTTHEGTKGGLGGPDTFDVVAFHIVTAGRRVSEVARAWFAANDYQRYLFLHGLGVETAEALAEYIHKQIRVELGIAGRDEREMQMLFKQGYQGSRFSFGYPACPRLEDQSLIMELLRPERIGISLSEEFQLEPEQSTSAIIAYHAQARYFSVR
jgi:5-methyltetrahydrofolate--homocysteine methyltransferase